MSAFETWTDHLGRVWRVSTMRRLKFRYPSHAALRVYVFRRDGYACRGCGARALEVPADYDGRDVLWTNRFYDNRFARRFFAHRVPLVLDHIVSRRNGGSNHPSNLQTLCDCCNSAKSGLVDAKASRAA